MTLNSSNKKNKRISFLIAESDYEALKFYSEKRGIVISKLIRSNLLVAINPKSINKIQSSKSKLLSLRLENSEYFSLRIRLKELKINHSEFFRALISQIIYTNSNSIGISQNLKNDLQIIPSLWQTGRLNEIIQIIENINNLEEVEAIYLIYYARAYAEFGFQKKAKNILQNINTKILDFKTRAIFEIASIDMALNARKINEAVIRLNKFPNEFLQEDTSRNLKALHLCQLGEMLSAFEDDNSAKQFFEQALDYVDIINYPLTLSRLYLKLGRANLFLGNYQDADKFYNKSNYVNQKFDNKVYKAWYFFDKSTLSYMNRENINLSSEYIEQALDIYKKIGHTRGIYYSYDSIGRINLSKDNYADAYKYFSEAEVMEKTIRGENSYSHTKFFKLFIESKHKYTEVVKKMENDLSKSETFRPTSTQYIYYETLFQNGDEADKNKGKQGLRKIISESKSPIIASVARRSLESGKFEVFR